MPAYVIVRVNAIHDPDAMRRYREQGRTSIANHHGRPLVLPGKQELLEGETTAQMIVLEFPCAEDARRWYHSPEYQQAARLRVGAADIDIHIVEGFVPGAQPPL